MLITKTGYGYSFRQVTKAYVNCPYNVEYMDYLFVGKNKPKPYKLQVLEEVLKGRGGDCYPHSLLMFKRSTPLPRNKISRDLKLKRLGYVDKEE